MSGAVDGDPQIQPLDRGVKSDRLHEPVASRPTPGNDAARREDRYERHKWNRLPMIQVTSITVGQ